MGRHFSPPKNKREEFVIRQRVHLQKKNTVHLTRWDQIMRKCIWYWTHTKQLQRRRLLQLGEAQDHLPSFQQNDGEIVRRVPTIININGKFLWRQLYNRRRCRAAIPRAAATGVCRFGGFFLCVTQTVVWSYTHTNLLRKVITYRSNGDHNYCHGFFYLFFCFFKYHHGTDQEKSH